jgi:hypothetical protein
MDLNLMKNVAARNIREEHEELYRHLVSTIFLKENQYISGHIRLCAIFLEQCFIDISTVTLEK